MVGGIDRDGDFLAAHPVANQTRLADTRIHSQCNSEQDGGESAGSIHPAAISNSELFHRSNLDRLIDLLLFKKGIAIPGAWMDLCFHFYRPDCEPKEQTGISCPCLYDVVCGRRCPYRKLASASPNQLGQACSCCVVVDRDDLANAIFDTCVACRSLCSLRKILGRDSIDSGAKGVV